MTYRDIPEAQNSTHGVGRLKLFWLGICAIFADAWSGFSNDLKWRPKRTTVCICGGLASFAMYFAQAIINEGRKAQGIEPAELILEKLTDFQQGLIAIIAFLQACVMFVALHIIAHTAT